MRHSVLISILLLISASVVGCKKSVSTQPHSETARQQATVEDSEPQTNPQIKGEVITYEVGGESFTGYLAYDANRKGPRPGVLVVHEWWGQNAYARHRAEQLAALGYTAFALDMYGTGKVAEHPKDAMAFMTEAISKTDAIKERFMTAEQLLKAQPTVEPTKIAAIGYCFGGGVVLNMAKAGLDLAGVASFHGSLEPVFAAGPDGVKAKILVMNGAADVMITPEQISAFKSEMDAAGADYRFINYEGAMHSFTNPGATAVGEENNMPLAYNEKADKESWAELQRFLDSIFN